MHTWHACYSAIMIDSQGTNYIAIATSFSCTSCNNPLFGTKFLDSTHLGRGPGQGIQWLAQGTRVTALHAAASSTSSTHIPQRQAVSLCYCNYAGVAAGGYPRRQEAQGIGVLQAGKAAQGFARGNVIHTDVLCKAAGRGKEGRASCRGIAAAAAAIAATESDPSPATFSTGVHWLCGCMHHHLRRFGWAPCYWRC